VSSSPLAIQQAHCCRLPLDRVAVVSLRARHLPRPRRGPVTINGNGGGERTPLLETRRGGISTSSSPTRPAAIPALEEPRVHVTVAHDACA
jgi:hypothetical protein